MKIDIDGSPTSREVKHKIKTFDKNIYFSLSLSLYIYIEHRRDSMRARTHKGLYDAGLFGGKGPKAIEGDVVFWTWPITHCEVSFESRVTTQIMWGLSLSKKRRLGNRMCDQEVQGSKSENYYEVE